MDKINYDTISILGPAGTYSEIACDKYLDITNLKLYKIFHGTISKTAQSILDHKLGILPFENTLDGYVNETLDSLRVLDLNIVGEIQIPVEFAFVTNEKDIDKIKNVYVQFKAKGQCNKFLNDHNFNIIETNSNVYSYIMALENNEFSAAIIPMHLIDEKFKYVIKNVEDQENNFTRFILVNNYLKLNEIKQGKCSLILDIKKDIPGILQSVLEMFKTNQINLSAIMSRPTKKGLGKYYFYLELEVVHNQNQILDLIEKINLNNDYKIKNLGFYNSL